MRCARWTLVWAFSAFAASATAFPTRAADEAQISAAVAKGAAFLAKNQAPSPNYDGGSHGAGSAALAGLALLEAGTPPNDPALQNIARLVREKCLTTEQTYLLSLAVLFLDRLGDPFDVPTIQYAGVRLYAGLTAFGGWTYNCGDQLGPVEETRLRALLQQSSLVGRPASPPKKDPLPPSGFPTPKPAEKKEPAGERPPSRLHPEVARLYLLVRQSIRAGRPNGEGDNSNTQFGLIGLWVASRHGLPADDAFALIEARFLASQNRADAGWGYYGGAIGGSSTTAMTCAGLLGLAVGGGRGKEQLAEPPKDPKTPAGPNDPFNNPKKPETAPAAPLGANGAKKAAIEAALTSLGRALQASKQGGLNGFVGLGNAYYMLWSIERVAVAFSLETIGGVDWYSMGCDFLLPAQGPDGSWTGNEYGTDVNTAFAILFLLKSNFVRDLSRKLDVKDPGKTELRGGGSGPTFAAPKTANGSTGGEGGAKTVATTPPAPNLPKVTSDDPTTEELVAATGTDWSAKLQSARDSKGEKFTSALVRTIPRVDGAKQKQARDALAERLTRMTAGSLRMMLGDADVELRGAACLAVAMKDDKAMIPDLIAKVTDPTDFVVRAARASLRALTDQDFGPQSNAVGEAKAKAATEWKKWYDEVGRR